MDSSNLKQIRLHALNLLSRREHTESELLRKLQTKGFSAENIGPVLQQLTQEKLINPTRFIESYIHSRSNKGYGPLRIQAELSEKGISQELIEEHLNIADNVWLAKAQRVWEKRFKGQKPKDYQTKTQQMRFLNYRGFTLEQIEKIFEG